MKAKNVLFLFLVLLFVNASAQDYSTRTMNIRFNGSGHEYAVHDLLSEQLDKSYLSEFENIKTKLHQGVRDAGGSNIDIIPPDHVSEIKYSGNTNGRGRLEMRINTIKINFEYGECRYDTKFDLILTADIQAIADKLEFKLKMSNIQTSSDNFKVNNIQPTSGWLFWLQPLCNAGKIAIDIIYDFSFSTELKQKIDNKSFSIFRYSNAADAELLPSKITEAINSFPIQFTITGGANNDLVIGMDFMKGTTSNPTAFVGITPPSVSDPTFDHLGFNLSGKSLDGVFSTYTTNPQYPVGSMEGIGLIAQSIRNYNGQSVIMDFTWNTIANHLFETGNYDPNALQGATLESAIQNLYNNGYWDKTDSIMDLLQNNAYALDVIGQLGGISEINDPSGHWAKMVPDNNISGYVAVDPIDGKSYNYVNPNTYLYFQKILARATVRRYRDKIGIWLIEAELNAARLNTWWRRGDCWLEEGTNGFQWKVWRTWVDAVREEDPSAKIATALHMLKFQYGLETFGPDCDIIGVNLYPNELFATPVLGFAVGEFVWATRRALTGMGWGSKQVYVTETNYPGLPNLTATSGEEPPTGTTLEQDRVWYSYGRQKKYLRDAVQSAATNGAKGFFWWNFLDSEAGYNPLPYTGYGSFIIGNSNPIQFKPVATEFSAQSVAKHPGKTLVTLTNSAVSNPALNLGGNLGIFGERDNIPSGTQLYSTRNRGHISQTSNQILGVLKHQSWNGTVAEFHLKENFHPQPSEVATPRNARFDATNPITLRTALIEGGTTTASTLNYLDPWWVDANGNQNVLRAVSLVPTFSDNVFLGQNPTFDPAKPNYKFTAPATQAITVNGQQITSVFQNWSYSNATVENVSAQTTGVVFNAGATLTANYKGHLLSSTNQATSGSVSTYGNNARKIVVDNSTGYKYATYCSNNAVWFTRDVGAGWTSEVKLGDGENPCIDLGSFSIENNGYTVWHVVWEKLEGSSRRIYYCISSDGGLNWSTSFTWVVASTTPTTPVVFASWGNGSSNVVVVWQEATGLRLRFDPLSPKSFLNYLQVGSSMPAGVGNGSEFNLVYSWNGQIWYKKFTKFEDPSQHYIPSGSIEIQISDPTTTNNINPSISSYDGNNDVIGVAWENSTNHTVYYSQSTNGGSIWAMSPPFTHSGHQLSKPSISAFGQLVFQCGTHIGESIKNGGTWSPVMNIGTGIGPTLALESDIPQAMWTSGSSAPFKINFLPLVPTYISGGTISNFNWSGIVNVTGSAILNSGATLNIAPGTAVSFAAGATLVINGKLIANGTSSQRITFTSATSTNPGSWGSIIFSGSGADNSSIQYANIEYGTNIQINNNATHVNINDCNISNQSGTAILYTGASNGNVLRNVITSTNIYHGITVESGSTVRCDQNTITKSGTNQRRGIGILFSGGGDGTAWQNDIQGWDWGIGAIWGSSPEFKTYNSSSHTKGNRIKNCNSGVYAYNSAYPVIGEPAPGWGYNTIVNNGKNIYYTSGGTLYAFTTYWGDGGPNPLTMFTLGSGCTVNTSYWLANDPWNSGQQSIVFNETGKRPTDVYENSPSETVQMIKVENSANVSRDDDDFFSGIKLREERGKRFAKDFFKSYIAKNTDDQRAFVELYKCYDEETANEVIQYFSNLPSKAAKEHELLLGYLYLKRKDIESAKNINNNIISRNKNNELGVRAILNNFYIALYNENDIETAEKLLRKVVAQSKLSTSVEIELAQQALATYVGRGENNKLRKEETRTIKAVPDKYELQQNYPNPFNPTTTINYQLPSDTYVTLKVYDMVGREVVTLVDGVKSTGYYTETFDASILASGMYIYKLTSDKFSDVKKMMLIK